MISQRRRTFWDLFGRTVLNQGGTGFVNAISGGAMPEIVDGSLVLTGVQGVAIGHESPEADYALQADVTFGDDTDVLALVLRSGYDTDHLTDHYVALIGPLGGGGQHPASAYMGVSAGSATLFRGYDGGLGLQLATVNFADMAMSERFLWELRAKTEGNLVRLELLRDGYTVLEKVDSSYQPELGLVPHLGAGRWAVLARNGAGETTPCTIHSVAVTRPYPLHAVGQAAYDEPYQLVRFAVPVEPGSYDMELLNYHLLSQDWTREALNPVMFWMRRTATGQRRVCYSLDAWNAGVPIEGVWQIDGTQTRHGSAVTGTWRSNWLPIAGGFRSARVTRARLGIEAAAGRGLIVTVETCADPTDHAQRIQRKQLILANYNAIEPFAVDLEGRFARFTMTNQAPGEPMRLRTIELELG